MAKKKRNNPPKISYELHDNWLCISAWPTNLNCEKVSVEFHKRSTWGLDKPYRSWWLKTPVFSWATNDFDKLGESHSTAAYLEATMRAMKTVLLIAKQVKKAGGPAKFIKAKELQEEKVVWDEVTGRVNSG
jgi:hypothetical protein